MNKMTDTTMKIKIETRNRIDELFPEGLSYDAKVNNIIELIPERVRKMMNDLKNEDTGRMFAKIVMDSLDKEIKKSKLNKEITINN
jgi:hypothetical protein